MNINNNVCASVSIEGAKTMFGAADCIIKMHDMYLFASLGVCVCIPTFRSRFRTATWKNGENVSIIIIIIACKMRELAMVDLNEWIHHIRIRNIFKYA